MTSVIVSQENLFVKRFFIFSGKEILGGRNTADGPGVFKRDHAALRYCDEKEIRAEFSHK